MRSLIVFGLGMAAGLAAAGLSVGWPASAQPSAGAHTRGVTCPCPGDADCNGIVNFADITEVLTNWDFSCAPDGDGDGVPDEIDNCPNDPNPGQEDADNDGTGDACEPVDLDMDGWTSDVDCDDSNASINPAAPEQCNGIDDNCNGVNDDNPVGGTPFWRDADADGFGNPGQMIFACSQPSGYVTNPIDCNDSNSSINPAAPEQCNGIDDNCNNQVDENPIGANAWFADNDNDGWGAIGPPLFACNPPPGFVAQSGDCDDFNSSINPGHPEVCHDGLDNNCDGLTDPDCGPIP